MSISDGNYDFGVELVQDSPQEKRDYIDTQFLDDCAMSSKYSGFDESDTMSLLSSSSSSSSHSTNLFQLPSSLLSPSSSSSLSSSSSQFQFSFDSPKLERHYIESSPLNCDKDDYVLSDGYVYPGCVFVLISDLFVFGMINKN